jgi:hypothetical protein
MIALLSAVALAADPTMCDPKKNTAPVTAEGFCLGVQEYTEFGQVLVDNKTLKSELAARDAEITAFEEWKKTRDADFQATLSQVDKNAQVCEQQIELAQHRTFMEKYGFVLGASTASAAFIGALIVLH